MSEFRPGSPDQSAFLAQLLEAGHLIDSGIPGVYGRGDAFERVRLGFDAAVTAAAADEAPERLTFPPLLPRRQIEDLGYLKSFPHLAGTVFAFEGDEAEAAAQEAKAEAHEDWSEHQEMTDLMLKPAACYPLYPAIGARGPLAPGGVTVDIGGAYVFRHEPSGDPARMQTFQMREIVRIGEPELVLEWRDRWRDRAVELLRGVGLDADPDVASDPFFGRPGRLLARSQKAQELKFELMVPIAEPEETAVASFNYHQDHFSSVYGIEMAGPGDTTAHTACLGFGLERITLALLRKHGLEIGNWPDEVRARLSL
jgi:seryl-tRNA synthetase